MIETTHAKTIKEVADLSNKTIVYIAAKVTGLPTKEVAEKFYKAHKQLEELDYFVINPIDIVHPDAHWQHAMRICISFLPYADKIYLLPDYHQSEGALLEAFIAGRLGIETLEID